MGGCAEATVTEEDDDVVFVDDDNWMGHSSVEEVEVALRVPFVEEIVKLVGSLSMDERLDALKWLPRKLRQIGTGDVTAERMAKLYIEEGGA